MCNEENFNEGAGESSVIGLESSVLLNHNLEC